MRQAAGTRYLVKGARGDERRQKQLADYFRGRTVEMCILLYLAQLAVVGVDEEFPLPLLIPCVGDIWAKISAGVLGNA